MTDKTFAERLGESIERMPESQRGAVENVGLAVEAEVLGASVQNANTASVSIRIDGQFVVPGTKVVIEPIVAVVSVPAKVMPA